MTLPSASSLTDEQLRVLCALTQGFRIITPLQGARKERWPQAIETCQTGEFVGSLPDPLHDANAAKELLNRHGQWEVSRDEGLVIGISVTIYKPDKAFVCTRPDFCRAVVIAVLRAEGKIL